MDRTEQDSFMVVPGARFFPDNQEMQVWPGVFREDGIPQMPPELGKAAADVDDETLATVIAFAAYARVGIELDAVDACQCGDKEHWHFQPAKGETHAG